MYDVTNSASLSQEAEYWIKDIEKNAPPHIIIGLAGNKCDMHERSEVNLEEVRNFTARHKINITNECSAKTDQGINEIFQKICQSIDENKERLKSEKGFNSGINIKLSGNDRRSTVPGK